MNEVSYFGASETINTVTLDDPELFKYPVAYIIEVSWWQMTDTQAAALRAYMQKGGFVIVDDFKAEGDFGSPGWGPFEQNMRRVLPGVALRADEPDAPDLPLVLRDRQPRHHSAGLQRRQAVSSSASTRTTIRRSG